MSVRMRHTHGHTRNRRAHHALKSPRLSACTECGAMHLRHRICDTCGSYRGRTVIDMDAVNKKKAERIQRKNRDLGIDDAKPKSAQTEKTADTKKEAKES